MTAAYPRGRLLAGTLGLLVAFSALARGAHDLWAATLVYLAALAILAGLILRSAYSSGRDFPADFLAPIGGVAAAFSLSFFGSVHPAESRLGWMDWLAASAVFLAALSAFRAEEAADVFLSAVVPVFWLELPLILRQRCEHVHFLAAQAPGTLVNSTLLAAFLIFWFPPLLSRVMDRGRARSRWFWASGLLCVLLSLLLLNSIWAVLCLVLSLPLLAGPRSFAERVRSRPKQAAGAAVLLLAGGCALVAWKLLHAMDMDGAPVPLGESLSRLSWWLSGLRMFADHPWLGVGTGNFPSAYLAYKTGAVQHTLYAHSSIVGLLAETGLLGFLSALALVAWLLARIRSRWDWAESRWPFLLGLLLFLAYGLISLSMEYLVNLLTAAAFMGIAAAPTIKTGLKPPKAAAVFLAVLALAAVPWLVSPLLASRKCVHGEELLASGSLEGAMAEFRSAAGMDRRCVEARRGLAKAYFIRHRSSLDPKDIEEAVSLQRAAAALDRLNGRLWGELGEFLLIQGRKDEAVECLRKAAKLNASDRRFERLLAHFDGMQAAGLDLQAR
ncbi:MAG: O-antigen ligase family protein [Elusimicrobia bacterium]|nr:O-antigen ligase family protein [Elusimicrobiota bacterium]